MMKLTYFARRAGALAGFAITAAVISMTSSAAIAQGQPPRPVPSATVPEPRILVIDRQAVLGRSKVGADLRQQYQQYTQTAEAQLKGEADGLRKEGADLQKQVAILAPDVKNAKIKAFEAKQQAFQQKVQARQQQLRYGLYLAQQQIDKALGPIIAGIMQERSANLLLDRSAVVFGTNGAFDITTVAIQRLDQKLPTLKLQMVSPPPGMMQQQPQQQGQ
jgi:outer membrane protein